MRSCMMPQRVVTVPFVRTLVIGAGHLNGSSYLSTFFCTLLLSRILYNFAAYNFNLHFDYFCPLVVVYVS